MAEKHTTFTQRKRRAGRKPAHVWLDVKTLTVIDALKERHGLADRGAVIEYLCNGEEEDRATAIT